MKSLKKLLPLIIAAFTLAGCGTQGEPGPQGPAGRSILSVTLTSTSGLVDTYTITYSDQTTSTFTITNGALGQTGTSFLQGNIDPANEIGNNGDTYLNISSCDLFKKDSGVWSKVGSVKGETGPQGVSITGSTIDENGDLIVTFSNGQSINAGHVKDVTKYTVNFYYDSVEGTPLKSIQVEPFSTIEAYYPEKTGYSLGQYHVDGYSERPWVFEGYYADRVTSDVNLVCPTTPNDYVVTFDANGGTCAKETLDVTFDAAYELPTATKQYVAFSKWVDEDGNEYPLTGNWTTAKDLTLYAVYDEIVTTFTFDTTDGTLDVESKDLTMGKPYELPIPTTTKKELDWEYGFDYWSLDGNKIPTKGDCWSYTSKTNKLVAHYKLRDDKDYLDEKLMTSKHIGDSQIYIDGFNGNLELVYIPAFYDNLPITVIYGLCGMGNTSVKKVIVGKNVNYIYVTAFYNFKSITSLEVVSDNPTYTSLNCNGIFEKASGNALLRGCINTVIPDTCKTIKDNAFRFVLGMKSISIPESVTKIDDDAFSNCLDLESLTLPNKLQYIGTGILVNNTKIKTITIPKSVGTIIEKAFYQSAIEAICCEGYQALGGWNNGYNMRKYDHGSPVYIPVYFGVKDIFTSENLNYGHNDINGLTVLGPVDTGLTELVIPSDVNNEPVRRIGYCAFYKKATNLVSLTLPDTLAEICESGFNTCTSLTSITIPDRVAIVGPYAFAHCTNLVSVNLPAYLVEIDKNAFLECTKLKSIAIPENTDTIGEAAFSGCTSLTSVTLSNGLKYIQNQAFKGCTSLREIIIPASVLEMGADVFASDPNLTIYCEAESKPEGWDDNWSPSGATIVWGYNG